MAFTGLVYDPNPDDDIKEFVPTDSFIELVPDLNTRNLYLTIISNEAEGNSQSKGNKCNN